MAEDLKLANVLATKVDVKAARFGANREALRVLIDGVGLRYSWPPASRALRAAGVRVAVFLPTLSPLRAPFANLRNHRKILVVDGDVAFTGGMNIRSAWTYSASNTFARSSKRRPCALSPNWNCWMDWMTTARSAPLKR